MADGNAVLPVDLKNVQKPTVTILENTGKKLEGIVERSSCHLMSFAS